ncbi:hypothetical protein M9458_011658, partial [Cirrhinus mrigala]
MSLTGACKSRQGIAMDDAPVARYGESGTAALPEQKKKEEEEDDEEEEEEEANRSGGI